MNRRTFLSGSPLLPAYLWSACGSAPKRVIGVVPKGTSSTFWQPVYSGAMAAGRDFEVEVLWEAPDEETDIARQIEIVEGFIQRGVDGIVLAPSGRSPLVPAVEQAVAAGIPVTIFDSGIDTDHYVSYVATDNRAAGGMAAKAVADLLNGKGAIGMIKHVPGSDSTEEREQGFSEAIRLLAPKLRVVASEYCMSFRARALSVAKEMLAAYPNLGALFGSSEAATMGAMRALGAPGQQRRVKLVGFDASFSLREGLRDDVVDALVVQDPFYIGYAGVKTVVQKLNGVEPPKRIDSPARLVTAAHLDDADIVKLLDPPGAPR